MNSAQRLLLIVDDELPIRRFLRSSLTAEGYVVVEAATGSDAIRQAQQRPPDLVLLDLGLPDVDGQEVLHRLRQWLRAPIIVLSARHEEKQKILALDNGADDYLTKPFSTGELLARIRVAIRHATKGHGESSASFEFGELKIDLSARIILLRGKEIHLTPLEYKLLATLAQHAGKVLTHRFLLNEVWGPHHLQESHYLRVYMAGLRRKLELDPTQPKLLRTEQGVGYRLMAE